ncbi:fimbrial protein [uncultured Parabacteroides sp.]|uniref:fimbrial protein n=1 Tax=uncultured Parabacteroides sp. TaxID=512312 RepID=UPI0025D0710E|nr:fimbrial protein [uncultured Parabacteroides sp.]
MIIHKVILSISVVTLLASCSKDEGPSTPPVTEATLSVGLQLRSETESKATNDDPNALPGESDIHSLSAYVFSSDGSELIGYGHVENPNSDMLTVTNIETRPERIMLVVLANLPESIAGSIGNYAGLQSSLADLASQSQESLTFSTQVIRTEQPLVKGEDNLIGFTAGDNIDNISTPLLLTRIAARVEMNTIETRFANSPLEGKTVRIDHIALANVKSKSYYFSEADWGKVEAPVGQASLIYGAGVSEAASLFAPASYPSDFLGSDFNLTVNDKTPRLTPVFETYAFENSSSDAAPTLLVVKATLLETNQTRLFTSPINRNGVLNGYDHNYVKRNYIYRLHVTFTETSFDNDASLDVRVEVAGWGYVHQTEEIK